MRLTGGDQQVYPGYLRLTWESCSPENSLEYYVFKDSKPQSPEPRRAYFGNKTLSSLLHKDARHAPNAVLLSKTDP